MPHIPMIAPLFDRMMTANVKLRFTAREALEFLNNIEAQLSESQRRAKPELLSRNWRETGIRWKGLPEDFAKQWASYMNRPPSLWTRFLHWVCMYGWAYRIVSGFRRLVRL